MIELKETCDLLHNIQQFVNERQSDGTNQSKGVEQEHEVIPRVLHQECDGLVLYTWDSLNAKQVKVTYVGCYDPGTQTNQVILVGDAIHNIGTCSVNRERSLLAYTTVEQQSPNSTAKLIRNYQDVYRAYIAELLPQRRTFSLNLERENFIKVQFLYGTPTDKMGYLLVMLHKESVGLYSIPLARINKGIIMSGQPTTERIVRKFIWCEWDGQNQRLYYVRTRKTHADTLPRARVDSGKDGKDVSTFVCLQFHQEAKFDFMLELPFTMDLPPVFSSFRPIYGKAAFQSAIPDISLNMSVLTRINGTLCICYQHPVPVDVLLANEEGQSTFVDQSYSVTLPHHAKILHGTAKIPLHLARITKLCKLQFFWLNEYLVVTLPGCFIHLLNVSVEFEPVHHILLHNGIITNDKTSNSKKRPTTKSTNRTITDSSQSIFNFDTNIPLGMDIFRSQEMSAETIDVFDSKYKISDVSHRLGTERYGGAVRRSATDVATWNKTRNTGKYERSKIVKAKLKWDEYARKNIDEAVDDHAKTKKDTKTKQDTKTIIDVKSDAKQKPGKKADGVKTDKVSRSKSYTDSNTDTDSKDAETSFTKRYSDSPSDAESKSFRIKGAQLGMSIHDGPWKKIGENGDENYRRSKSRNSFEFSFKNALEFDPESSYEQSIESGLKQNIEDYKIVECGVYNNSGDDLNVSLTDSVSGVDGRVIDTGISDTILKSPLRNLSPQDSMVQIGSHSPLIDIDLPTEILIEELAEMCLPEEKVREHSLDLLGDTTGSGTRKWIVMSKGSNASGATLYHTQTGKVYKPELNTSALVKLFKDDSETNSRLALLHYTIRHYRDATLYTQLFSALYDDPANLDVSSLMGEFLVASTYGRLRKQLSKDLYRLLPFTGTETFRGRVLKDKNGTRLATITYGSMKNIHIGTKSYIERGQWRNVEDMWDNLSRHLLRRQLESSSRMFPEVQGHLPLLWKHVKSGTLLVHFILVGCYQKWCQMKDTSICVAQVFIGSRVQEVQRATTAGGETEFSQTVVYKKYKELRQKEERQTESIQLAGEGADMPPVPEKTTETSSVHSDSSLSSLPSFLQEADDDWQDQEPLASLEADDDWQDQEPLASLMAQSRQLLNIIWSASPLNSDMSEYLTSTYLLHPATPDEAQLFRILQKYLTAILDIAFPSPFGLHTYLTSLAYKSLPYHMFLQYTDRGVLNLTETFLATGLHTYLTSLAYKSLPYHMFLQYTDRGVLNLTETFMKRFITELPNSDEYVQKKSQLMSRLSPSMRDDGYKVWNHPIAMRYRMTAQVHDLLLNHDCYKVWNHPIAMRYRMTAQVHDLLLNHSKYDIIESVKYKKGTRGRLKEHASNFHPLDTLIQYIHSLDAPEDAEKIVDLSQVNKYALYNTRLATGTDLSSIHF